MNLLRDKLLGKESGLLFYGLTPPKLQADEEKIREIANKQMERLDGVQIDGLVLYDVQDESSRTDQPRPFPYMQTLAPDYYSEQFLGKLQVPKILYKSVGKYTREEFKNWLEREPNATGYSVLVGTPSNKQHASLSLHDAYDTWQESSSRILLGGVTIPERHSKKGDEHTRVFDKIDKGCRFFISQCVYGVNNSKDFLSDYYYSSIENHRELVPIIFTLTPCGSVKTLQFMEWLGIDIPRWLNNDLKHSNDILSKSIETCKTIAVELLDFCQEKKIPVGFNIESIAIRKEEIEASIQLLKDVRAMMDK